MRRYLVSFLLNGRSEETTEYPSYVAAMIGLEYSADQLVKYNRQGNWSVTLHVITETEEPQ